MLMKKNGQLKDISVKTLVPIGARYKRYIDSKCDNLTKAANKICISGLHSFLISPSHHLCICTCTCISLLQDVCGLRLQVRLQYSTIVGKS